MIGGLEGSEWIFGPGESSQKAANDSRSTIERKAGAVQLAYSLFDLGRTQWQGSAVDETLKKLSPLFLL
jgi:hypothetical protein